jgi:STAM-binding protein
MPVVTAPPPKMNNTSGLRAVYCPLEILTEFRARAKPNTDRLIETCGILAGIERSGALYINTLIIPKQEGQQDRCHMVDEMELFQEQLNLDVMTLGWIHTHPQFVIT